MPLIALARVGPEAEQPVAQQQQPVAPRRGRVGLGRPQRQREARHHVRHHRVVVAEHRERQLGRLRLVDHRQHRVRVRVVDELVRQECVQQRLHRGVGRRRVEQARAQGRDHRLVAERLEPAQRLQRPQAHRRQPGRLDVRQVPAAALDARDLGEHSEVVGQRRLDRGVAAAVQHQRRLAAEQARAVHPQGQVLVAPARVEGGVVRDRGAGVGVGPGAFHARDLSPGRPARKAPPAGLERVGLAEVLHDRVRLEHRRAGVGVHQVGHLHLPGQLTKLLALAAAAAEVVQHVGQLQLAQRLTDQAAVRRALVAVQLERTLRHARGPDPHPVREAQQRPGRAAQHRERPEAQRQRHLAVAIALGQVAHDRVRLVQLGVGVRVDHQRELHLAALLGLAAEARPAPGAREDRRVEVEGGQHLADLAAERAERDVVETQHGRPEARVPVRRRTGRS
mgnify:CR=1 FL=1